MKAGDVFVLVFSLTHLGSVNELGELREQILRLKGRKVSTRGRVTWGSLPALLPISSATSDGPYALSLFLVLSRPGSPHLSRQQVRSESRSSMSSGNRSQPLRAVGQDSLLRSLCQKGYECR